LCTICWNVIRPQSVVGARIAHRTSLMPEGPFLAGAALMLGALPR
jgi:hypothetical protein